MTIQLSQRKIQKISEKIMGIIHSSKPTIRDLASVTGTLVATFQAIPMGKLHYRNMERLKISSLKNVLEILMDILLLHFPGG